MIDAIILAGGLGTRLQRVVPQVPKTLAPILGTPFLQILLDQLQEAKCISKIILALGYKAEMVADFIPKGLPLELSIEKEPLGTGGAVLLALPKVSSEDFLVINGDTFFGIDFDQFYAFHREKNSPATIAVRYEEEDASRYGSIAICEEQTILHFEEKSEDRKPGWISGGIYLIKKSTLDFFNAGNNYSIEKDFFPFLLKNRMFAYPSSELFIDIGTAQSYERAQSILQSRVRS